MLIGRQETETPVSCSAASRDHTALVDLQGLSPVFLQCLQLATEATLTQQFSGQQNNPLGFPIAADSKLCYRWLKSQEWAWE